MCNFYSFLTDEKGNRYAMGHQIRIDIRSGKSNLREDSHASIAVLHKVDEDKCNKYEFSPLIRKLKLDTNNLGFDDSELINIDELIGEVKEAVPELVIKPIVHPFKDVKFDGEITEDIVGLVREWSKVRVSVWGSVCGSVSGSVSDSVWCSVRGSVCGSVSDSVWDSVWCSVRDSVRDVWDSVRASVRDSVYAYVSSFFNIKYPYDYSSAIKLWEMGLVPSFDGDVWRINSYKGVVWTGKI